jgi:WD40 repeat protein
MDRAGNLIVNTVAGVNRWPLRSSSDSPESVTLGPPERVPIPGSNGWVAAGGERPVVAISRGNDVAILHPDQPNHFRAVEGHRLASYVSVSRHGRYVVSGAHHGVGLKVWEAVDGKLIKEPLSDVPQIYGMISPNGKWLLTHERHSTRSRLWHFGTWEPGPELGESGMTGDFSPDGSILALSTFRGPIRLINPEDGREYARLDGSFQDNSETLTFSPDGATLIATTGTSRSIHVWDLHLIRSQLQDMGLDWELPPLAQPSPTPPRPIQLRIDLGTPDH